MDEYVSSSEVADERVASLLSVWLIEDNHLYRRSIASLINQTEGMHCPIATASCEEAVAALEDGEVPDIVLMDIGLPGMSGIEGARRIRTLSPASRVIMLTVHEEKEHIFEAVCAGASGYLLKPASAEGVIGAVREVQRGAAPINGYIARKMLDMFAGIASPAHDYGLTRRESEILQLMVDGLTMRQIADELCVSYHTIDTHIRNIYEKLHVHSRSRAVAKAVQERLL